MEDRIHEIHEKVRTYYSELTNLKGGELASAVCSCSAGSISEPVKQILADLPDEILARYYGCGSPIPDGLEGLTILDLGCGTGRDVYVVSKLAGKTGRVIGIDMNDDQLAIAEKYRNEMAEKWGFANVEFRKGFIEDLASAGIEDNSIDVVISNCVINLSPDKDAVFSEIWRVLKAGGVLYFSDIYADKPVPAEINTHPLLLGECLGGALSHDEFAEIMKRKRWKEFKVVSSHEAPINNPEIEKLVEGISFSSDTVSAVKMPENAECSCKPVIPTGGRYHIQTCCCGNDKAGCC